MRLIDEDALLALYPDCRGLKEKLNAIPTVGGEWVKCSERMPEANEDVWVYLDDGRVERDSYDPKEDGEVFRVMSGDGSDDYEEAVSNGWYLYGMSDSHPIYWMPIVKPEPPQTEA